MAEAWSYRRILEWLQFCEMAEAWSYSRILEWLQFREMAEAWSYRRILEWLQFCEMAEALSYRRILERLQFCLHAYVYVFTGAVRLNRCLVLWFQLPDKQYHDTLYSCLLKEHLELQREYQFLQNRLQRVLTEPNRTRLKLEHELAAAASNVRTLQRLLAEQEGTERRLSVAYPGIIFEGGVQQIQLRTEDRENGDLGTVAP